MAGGREGRVTHTCTQYYCVKTILMDGDNFEQLVTYKRSLFFHFVQKPIQALYP